MHIYMIMITMLLSSLYPMSVALSAYACSSYYCACCYPSMNYRACTVFSIRDTFSRHKNLAGAASALLRHMGKSASRNPQPFFLFCTQFAR
jgi:hypothetical protein